MKKKLKIDDEKEMTYEEYIEEGKLFAKDLYEKPITLTKAEYEKMLERKKITKELEHKIDELTKEYSEIFFKNIPKEDIKGIDISNYGYYEILEYCIDKIKKNDKNITGLLCSALGNKCEN